MARVGRALPGRVLPDYNGVPSSPLAAPAVPSYARCAEATCSGRDHGSEEAMSILFFVQPGEAEANGVLLFLLTRPSPAVILFALHPN